MVARCVPSHLRWAAVLFLTSGMTQWIVRAATGSTSQNAPVIENTWYGTPRNGPAYNFTIHQENNGEVPIYLEAPFYNEQETPRSTPMGGFLGLLNYEAFEMQFIGDGDQCLHIVVGPAGHYIIFLMYNEQLSMKDDLRMAYDSKVSYFPPYWKATIKIPLEYFPKNVKKFNAASRHGLRHKRSMDVLYVDAEPLPSHFTSPPFRTAQSINFEKVLLTYDNTKVSKVWERAIDEYRNAPHDTSSPVTGSAYGGPLVGALFLAYTSAYVAFIKYM
ncbi:UPF0462 protein C4orf33-like isoform X2 [Varroa jacobsoni]|uniref:UPF0462 protein C4orf33-like isoform X2 n=1 Tax=Varroa jacobsoni TaxID=62625 RepID=UPI000BF79199|nr:UPF0462 protein C4orf33-like isoform X2 [Varroa jacobsoni]